MTAEAPVLNLNNEVVKMRKNVKKVKALTIRKLIRHISQLKSKKGTEEQVLKNQRRAQRLVEEMKTIKMLKPDDVTKTALREDVNLDSIFKKADSSVEDRAISRLASHPMLKVKISTLKDAIKNFKESRTNHVEQEDKPEQLSLLPKPEKSINQEPENKPKQGKAKQKSKPEKTKVVTKVVVSPAVEQVAEVVAEVEQEDEPEEPFLPTSPAKTLNQEAQNKPKQGMAKQKSKPEEVKVENKVMDNPVVKTENKNTNLIPLNPSNEEPSSPTIPLTHVSQAVPEVQTQKKKVLQSNSEKATVQNEPDKKIEPSIPDQKLPSINESDSSDIEDSDEEDKEYFDDSTEERFLKQSSGFEDSDSDSEDDFFIGKVRKTKKKKSSKDDSEEKKEKLPPANTKPSVSGTEVQKASTGLKNVKLESVFCTSLSQTKQKSSYMKRESKFPPVRNNKPDFPRANTLSRKSQPVKASAVKQNKVEEQTLHPSWEASRKRKEQSQIAVFQGKKIVFGD